MMNLAIWLKKNGFRADQVQTFYPSPMATATTMYHTGKNPLAKVARYTENVDIVKGDKRRRIHKAFLRYHDSNNWPLLREALKEMGRADLIGNSKQHLIPTYQPVGTEGQYQSARKKNSTVAGDSQKRSTDHATGSNQTTNQSRPSNTKKRPERGQILTQHTGLPPRETSDQQKPFGKAKPKGKAKSKIKA